MNAIAKFLESLLLIFHDYFSEMYDDFYGRSLDEPDFCVSPATGE